MASSSGGSWASLLGATLPTRNDKNVMEIVLEKDTKGYFSVSDQEVAKALQKLGADLRPGVHIEAVQICPMGKNVIQVTLNKNVEIEKFSNKGLFEVKTGVRISQVRASGQREVVLLVKGLHPNTLDETVIRYLRCMGKVEKTKVILDTYKEGPLAGLQNGDRKYTVEFKADIFVGYTHVIDGHKVKFSFPGQRRSCYRCLRIHHECPGYGVAKDCEAAGGERRRLSDYMMEFWSKIGFKPEKDISADDLDGGLEAAEDIQHQVGGNFTPKARSAKDPTSPFGAVSVKWFPKKADHDEIREFLIKFGVPEKHDDIIIKENGQVIIENLEPELCKYLCDNITGNKFKDKKLIYCNGIVLVTPEKKNALPPSSKPASQSSNSNSILATTSPKNPVLAPKNPPTIGLGTVVQKINSTEPESITQDPFGDYIFSPPGRIKSKLLDGSDSDTEEDNASIPSYLDESDAWLTKNGRKGGKNNKRKGNNSPGERISFKKADKRTTPKSRK